MENGSVCGLETVAGFPGKTKFAQYNARDIPVCQKVYLWYQDHSSKVVMNFQLGLKLKTKNKNKPNPPTHTHKKANKNKQTKHVTHQKPCFLSSQ